MNVIPTLIPDVKVIEPAVFGDDRGFFMENWNAQLFTESGLNMTFVQDNHSRSSQGVLRGLHYQTEKTQGKLVRATVGEVYDVAVDLRRSSDTFGQWVGVTLSEQNKKMLWVPEGFAHGFYVVSETADFQYKCTNYYAPEYEQSVLWNDPQLGINWPLVGNKLPSLSVKDECASLLADSVTFP